MQLPQRKPNRLPSYDYSASGAYFLTLCTKKRKCLLSSIVGGGALDAPQIILSNMGRVVEKYILSGNRCRGICVEKYVIMPNHVHLLLSAQEIVTDGTSRAPSPTNALIPHFVSTLKRFCHRDIGAQIFQRSYHDHVIRSEQDYLKIWQYIDTNSARWKEDCFFEEQ